GTNAYNMVWHVQFNLPKLPAGGSITLNTVWAGDYQAAIQVFVNDPTMTNVVSDFYPNIPYPTGVHGDSLIRQGIHDKYGINHTSIPLSKFVTGTNLITLVQRKGAGTPSGYALYDYLDLELPTAAAPLSLAATGGDGKVVLNWPASPGASGYFLRRSTASAGPYLVVGANLPGLAFTNSGLVNGTMYYYTITATNAFGESALSSPISARPTSDLATNLLFSAAPGQLAFSWPVDHTGWILQAQTNSLDRGLGTNWTDVLGSDATNVMTVPFLPANAGAFFRLIHP
ncbi:MAG TPA: polysaccharide lyase family protein, partial [Verrucomicrobiae bacterium]|nr:polysaccharide lyase family protein [Verrucomicrobiae bacterium]